MGTTAGVWACASEFSAAHWVKQNVCCWLAGSVSPDGSSSCVVLCERRRLLHLIQEFEPAGYFMKGSLGWDAQGGSDSETGEIVFGRFVRRLEPLFKGGFNRAHMLWDAKEPTSPLSCLNFQSFMDSSTSLNSFPFLRLIYACSPTLHLLRF